MEQQRMRTSRLVFRFLEIAFGFLFLWMVAHHLVNRDVRPLVAFCLPILVVFYGFASVLFVRGKALAAGPWQIRSLYAAERAMQATVWYLLGIILGVTAYGLLRYLKVPWDSNEPWFLALLLTVFLPPYSLMQTGLLCFMRAVWIVVPQFVRPVGALEIARRVHQVKST
jgi:hypothetical protein